MARKRTPAEPGTGQTDPAVEAMLENLEHPLRENIATVRRMILETDASIREAVKWNAPSFRTTEFFATFHLRSRDRVQLVLHTGAKRKATAETGLPIDDPDGLLQWLAKDRCMLSLESDADLEATRAGLQAIVRQWITHV